MNFFVRIQYLGMEDRVFFVIFTLLLFTTVFAFCNCVFVGLKYGLNCLCLSGLNLFNKPELLLS